MPIFDYGCPKCNYIEEVLVMKEEPDLRCPNCDEPLEKKVSCCRLVNWKGGYIPETVKRDHEKMDTKGGRARKQKKLYF